MPLPPPGVRVGSPAYRVYREEAYQMLRLQVKELRHDFVTTTSRSAKN